MTNRDAIEILQRNIPGCDYDLSEAVTLAIAALEQQGEDNEWCLDCKEYDKEQHCCHRFTKVIRQAVEDHRRERPVYGKWIRSGTEGHIICNKCGYEAKYTIVERQDAIGKWISRFAQDMKPNFCPNCGAKMDDERKGEHEQT